MAHDRFLRQPVFGKGRLEDTLIFIQNLVLILCFAKKGLHKVRICQTLNKKSISGISGSRKTGFLSSIFVNYDKSGLGYKKIKSYLILLLHYRCISPFLFPGLFYSVMGRYVVSFRHNPSLNRFSCFYKNPNKVK